MAQQSIGYGESKVDDEQIEKLSQEIIHPKHAHLLQLVKLQHHEESLCNICFRSCKECYIYFCKTCQFGIHVSCVTGIKEPKLIKGCHKQRDHSLIEKLSQEITHPKHAHTLNLIKLQDHEDSLCNICFQSCKGCHIYVCEICKFGIHVSCASGIEEPKLIKGCHKQRDHSLIHQKRPATFHCDACGKKEADTEPSYVCTECQLWIHESCASLDSEFEHNDHEHDLSLEFFLPERFQSFKLSCEVCGEKLHFAYWFYHCGRCSFFVHVKCAGKNRRVAEDNIETYPKLNLALLPEANESVQLIERFLEKNGILENHMPPKQIDNSQHKMHPLVLSKNTNKDDQLVCDGCIGSISDQYYYSCEPCNYFLHVTCSQLPCELQLNHPFHPEHLLVIKHPEYCYSVQHCSHCKLDTNGWWFECTEGNCEFRLDMKCALLPKAIAHKSHRHPLSRVSISDADCSACGENLSGLSSYGCEACGFYLGNDCARLPPTTTHKWDEHLLSLTFLPFIYHQDEILCEICEKFAHPKYWLYHCLECDQFFHPQCIPPHGPSRNIKFGSTIQIAEHSLKLVENGKYKSHCAVCPEPKRLDKKNALLCTACNLYICRECASDILEIKKMGSIANIPPCDKTLGDA